MTTPQITIHNALTGETVTRDINADEISQFETDKKQALKDADTKAKTEQTNANKRQTILDRLGITADELQTLLG